MTGSAAMPLQTNKALDVMFLHMFTVQAQQVEKNMLPAHGPVSNTKGSNNKVRASNCKAHKARFREITASARLALHCMFELCNKRTGTRVPTAQAHP